VKQPLVQAACLPSASWAVHAIVNFGMHLLTTVAELLQGKAVGGDCGVS
jgi:hypothetical protein